MALTDRTPSLYEGSAREPGTVPALGPDPWLRGSSRSPLPLPDALSLAPKTQPPSLTFLWGPGVAGPVSKLRGRAGLVSQACAGVGSGERWTVHTPQDLHQGSQSSCQGPRQLQARETHVHTRSGWTPEKPKPKTSPLLPHRAWQELLLPSTAVGPDPTQLPVRFPYSKSPGGSAGRGPPLSQAHSTAPLMDVGASL